MSEGVDPKIYEDTISWLIDNLSNFSGGASNIVGAIAKDLGLKTFEYKGRAYYDRTYPYNTEVAKVLNRLTKEGILKSKFEGNRWKFRVHFIHQQGGTFKDEDDNIVYFALCGGTDGVVSTENNPPPNCPDCKDSEAHKDRGTLSHKAPRDKRVCGICHDPF